MALLNFSMVFHGKNGTLGIGNCICRVLCMSDSFSSVQGHSVHFVKLSDVKIFKGLLLPQCSSRLNIRKHVIEGNSAVTFSGDLREIRV